MGNHINKLTPELTGILSRLVIERGPMAWVARITDGQLDRKTYVALNDALVALGGKWHKGVKGHLFAEDPSDMIDSLILTGVYKTQYHGDFFQTPESIATQMAEWAVRPGNVVLEPSAGHGRLVKAAFAAHAGRVDCFEIDPARVEELRKLRGEKTLCKWGLINCADFLAVQPTSLYDAIVMNPPFSRSADAKHILHALKFLERGGRLAALASNGIRFRQDAASKELRSIIPESDIEVLPERSFSSEGTDIPILLISYEKP